MQPYSFIEFIKSDYKNIYAQQHHTKNCKLKDYFKIFLLNPCGKYMFWLRLYRKLVLPSTRIEKIYYKPLLILCAIMHRHYSLLMGVQISPKCQIGKGFIFSHYSDIVINGDAIIGKDVTIYNGVTIGYTKSHKSGKGGVPVIGDGVILFPGAKVIGPIQIGDNSIISPNSVVINDVPKLAVVSGIPAKIISTNGSLGYFVNKD